MSSTASTVSQNQRKIFKKTLRIGGLYPTSAGLTTANRYPTPRIPLMRSVPSAYGPTLRRRLQSMCVSMLRSKGETLSPARPASAHRDPPHYPPIASVSRAGQIPLGGQVECLCCAVDSSGVCIQLEIPDKNRGRPCTRTLALIERDRRKMARTRAASSRALKGFGR